MTDGATDLQLILRTGVNVCTGAVLANIL